MLMQQLFDKIEREPQMPPLSAQLDAGNAARSDKSPDGRRRETGHLAHVFQRAESGALPDHR